MKVLLDVSDYNYVGEGGKHALFEHPVKIPGQLLRISKRHVALARRDWNPGKWSDSDDTRTATSSNSPRLDYIEQFVAPNLAPYVDCPQPVTVDWSSLSSLREKTLACGKIPVARRQDWASKKTEDELPEEPWAPACLVVDYRTIQDHPRAPHNGLPSRTPQPLTIELKPKAGYIAFSPLVKPDHRIKYLNSRFTLLQTLHQRGYIKKGWVALGQSVEVSKYDPTDLFSQEACRIEEAVNALLQCPQNNLKVWYGDAVIMNATISPPIEVDIKSIAPDLLGQRKGSDHDEEKRFENLVKELLVSALKQEELLDRLLKLQKLDILDVDGATLVFQRLVDLCGGSESEACREIESFAPCNDSTGHHPIMVHSPFQSVDDRSLTEFCDLVESFCKELSSVHPRLPPTSVIGSFHTQALQLISNLSRQGCSYLLSNWLFSLAMCDVSIFMTFEQRPASVAMKTKADEESTAKIESTLKSMGNDHVLISTLGEQLRFTYRMRAIDCDEKPATKIIGREKKETPFGKLKDMLGSL